MRFTYSLAVDWLTPRLAAIFRVENPLARNRIASLIFRIGNLFIGLPALHQEREATRRRIAQQRRYPRSGRVTGCPGIGDRIRSESLTG
jgi:hypothetical protein